MILNRTLRMRPFIARSASLVAVGSIAAVAYAQKSEPPTSPREVKLSAPAIEVAFSIEGSRPIPIVEAKVNGQGPFRFYFDTGASVCVLDSTFASEVGIANLGRTRVGDSTADGGVDADKVRIEKLAMGGAEWSDVPAIAFDRTKFGAQEGVKGVLGLPLAEKHLLTVDYGAGRIRISDETLPEKGSGIVPFAAEGPLPEIEIIVDGKPIHAHLDTGSPSGFTLPSKFVAGLKLKGEPVVIGHGRTVGSEFEVKRVAIDGDIVLGGRRFEDPTITTNDRFQYANIGREVLSQFVFSIDQRNRRMRFLPPSTMGTLQTKTIAPMIAPAKGKGRLGLQLTVAADSITVAGTDPGSRAEKAGLRIGDLILSVDGEALTADSMSVFQTAAQSGKAFELLVKRDGREEKVVVPAEAS